MQIIYAAPFILISLAGFILCLFVRDFRRFALPALVAPVAFGVCALAGFALFAVIGLKVLQSLFGSNIGISGWIEGLIFLFSGGLGAWFAITLIQKLERVYIRTAFARQFVLRLIISLIMFPVGFMASLGLLVRLSRGLSDGSLITLYGLAMLGAAFISALAFLATRTVRVDPKSST